MRELLTVCKGEYYSKFILTHKFKILSQWNNNKCAFHDVLRLGLLDRPSHSRMMKTNPGIFATYTAGTNSYINTIGRTRNWFTYVRSIVILLRKVCLI